MRCALWILLLTLSTAAFVECRDRLRLTGRDSTVSDEDLLQQSEATTTLSLTHSVKIYQQSDAVTPRLPTRVSRLARKRPARQEVSGKDDFDWETYLALNPDLPRRNYGSSDKALQHYR